MTINAVNTTLSGQSGTGEFAGNISPSFTTPTLGVATATSLNKVTITAPATGSTLTIADGKTVTASNTLTFTGTDSSSVNFGAGGTVSYAAATPVWAGIAGTTQAALANKSYVVQNAAQTTITLPAAMNLGDVVAVAGLGAAGWVLQANTGQTIHYGSSATTSGGTLTSTNLYDQVEVVCLVNNTTWGVRFSFSSGLTVA
jgi:hypothetical protein